MQPSATGTRARPLYDAQPLNGPVMQQLGWPALPPWTVARLLRRNGVCGGCSWRLAFVQRRGGRSGLRRERGFTYRSSMAGGFSPCWLHLRHFTLPHILGIFCFIGFLSLFFLFESVDSTLWTRWTRCRCCSHSRSRLGASFLLPQAQRHRRQQHQGRRLR